jgi:hypothetical protein
VVAIVESLSAYHEYEEQRLLIAVKNPEYKPDDNDLLDSEQLTYLGDDKLHFVTCDGGYEARIKKSPQAMRIHKVAIAELATAEQVESVLLGHRSRWSRLRIAQAQGFIFDFVSRN